MAERAHRNRIIILVLFILFAFMGLIAKLAYLQITKNEYYSRLGEMQRRKLIRIIPKRGNILDRNGSPIAVTVFVNSVNIDPKFLTPSSQKEVAEKLADILGIEREKLLSRMKKGKPTTVAKKISESQSHEIEQFMHDRNLPRNAVYLTPEGKRTYPKGELAAHILGYTTSDNYGDNKGLAGIELCYDEVIKGSVEKAEALQDALRKSLMPIDMDKYRSAFGNDIVLTIDEAIQHSAEINLAEAVDKHAAASGVCVVMDCNTGEILAIANYPTFNPNGFSKYTKSERNNIAIRDAVEPGSVMKIFTAAILLNAGVITPYDIIDCQDGYAYLNKTRVRDVHKMGEATFTEIIAESSNIGTVLAAMRLPREEIYDGLFRFGFGKKTGIELPGESAGILSPVSRWTETSLSAIPIGQEIATSAIQTATATCAIANGGRLMAPQLVRTIISPKGKVLKEFVPRVVGRPISEETSKALTMMMKEVVDSGTGTNAQIEGYGVAGKTGTAQKYDPELGRYSTKKYVSSFVGYLPTENPRVVIYVYIDEPQIGHYGGTVAAPVFKEVAEDCMSILGIPKSSSAQPSQTNQFAFALRRKTEAGISSRRSTMGKVPTTDVGLPAGTMPNLYGLTMREAMERISHLDLNIKIVGSGLAIDQAPEPGAYLNGNKWCKIEFKESL